MVDTTLMVVVGDFTTEPSACSYAVREARASPNRMQLWVQGRSNCTCDLSTALLEGGGVCWQLSTLYYILLRVSY